jgi:hypothetical protein
VFFTKLSLGTPARAPQTVDAKKLLSAAAIFLFVLRVAASFSGVNRFSHLAGVSVSGSPQHHGRVFFVKVVDF